MIIEVFVVAIYVGAILVPWWSLLQLNRFLAETSAIADVACLDRFKAVVRVQMFLALVYMAVFNVGVVFGSLALVSRHGMQGLVIMLLLNTVLFFFGRYHKRVEVKTCSLECASLDLAKEYQSVGKTWVKKALPDFWWQSE